MVLSTLASLACLHHPLMNLGIDDHFLVKQECVEVENKKGVKSFHIFITAIVVRMTVRVLICVSHPQDEGYTKDSVY